MSAAVSLARHDPRVERIVALTTLEVAFTGLAKAKTALEAAELHYLKVVGTAQRQRADELRAGIALGDARERVLFWIGIALRAELRAAELVDGHEPASGRRA